MCSFLLPHYHNFGVPFFPEWHSKPELKKITPFSASTFSSFDVGIRKDLKRSVIWLDLHPISHPDHLNPNKCLLTRKGRRICSQIHCESHGPFVPSLKRVQDRGGGHPRVEMVCGSQQSLLFASISRQQNRSQEQQPSLKPL